RHSDGTERSRERDAAVGNIDDDVRKRERLVARRREQLVDLSPAHLSVDQAAAEANAASDHAIDLEASVPFEPHLDDRALRREVRMIRIANDEIADLLGPETDLVEVVFRLDSAPLELALEIVRSDLPPVDPDDDDRNCKKDQDNEADRAGDSSPPRAANDDR